MGPAIDLGRPAKAFGHEVRVINPKKVKAFLQGQKTDANDALAIAMAATQFGVRFSLIKDEEQQTLQTLETSRKFLDKELTALNNHIRAYVYEYGITINRGRKSLRETVTLGIKRGQIYFSLVIATIAALTS